MSDYLERFRAAVAEIEAHPLLQLVTFEANASVSDAVIAAVEARLGAPLADPIRRFHQEADGLRLQWTARPELTRWERAALERACGDYAADLPENEDGEDVDDPPFASIYLLPLADAFIAHDWSGVIVLNDAVTDDDREEFAGVTYRARDFARRLRPFDLCTDYYCMAYLVEDGVGDPKVMLLGDHYVEWDYSRVTAFGPYLEMLLATRGIVAARRAAFGAYRGDRQPPLTSGAAYWAQYIPPLFGVHPSHP